MKKIYLLLTLMVVFLMTGCARKTISGKDVIKDFSYEADSFSEIEISDIYLKSGHNTYGPKVNILPGVEKKITISMDESFDDEIKVKKEGDKKIIQGNRLHTLMTNKFEINLYGYVLSDIDLSGACEATVSSSCVDKTNLDIELSGACTLTLDSYEGIDLNCNLSGASILNIAECKVENIDLDVSGASNIHISNLNTTTIDLDISGASKAFLLKGKTNTLSAEVSGASEVSAKEFELETGNAHISGASLMSIKVNQALTGEVSGASTLKYSGEGNVKVNVSGGSTAKKEA